MLEPAHGDHHCYERACCSAQEHAVTSTAMDTHTLSDGDVTHVYKKFRRVMELQSVSNNSATPCRNPACLCMGCNGGQAGTYFKAVSTIVSRGQLMPYNGSGRLLPRKQYYQYIFIKK